MQPSNQPAPPPAGNSPYDFILSPESQPKRSPVNNTSMGVRIALVLGGVFVLLIVVVLFMKLLSGGSGLNKSAMLSVAQDQTEIMRIADDGSQNAVSQSAQNFAVTAKLSVGSQQADLLAYLSDSHYKPAAKALALKQDANSDSQLASGKSSSTYDTTFKGVMKELLATYQKDLNAAYNDAGSKAQAILKSDYSGAQLLQKQLEAI